VVVVHDRNNNDLTSRHASEEEFHNLKFKEHSHPAHYKFNPTARIFFKMKEMIGDITGKRILEYGCGDGWVTAQLAAMGGIVDSFDISRKAVELTTLLLYRKNLGRACTVRKMPAEALEYPDNTFDIVFGFAILHHLDLTKAIPELHRVMKPSGCAYFAEPLGVNPAINLYRRLTPQHRTVDEHPLKCKDLLYYTRRFESFSHEEFYLTALLPLSISYIPILNRFTTSLLDRLIKLDTILLKKFPILGMLAWYTIITLKK